MHRTHLVIAFHASIKISFCLILNPAMYSLFTNYFDRFIPLYSPTSAFVASNPLSSIDVNNPFPAPGIDDLVTYVYAEAGSLHICMQYSGNVKVALAFSGVSILSVLDPSLLPVLVVYLSAVVW